VDQGEARRRWRTINPPPITEDDIARNADIDVTGTAWRTPESTELAAPKLIKLVMVDPQLYKQFDDAVTDSWKVFDMPNV
jgi:hypothetical protein